MIKKKTCDSSLEVGEWNFLESKESSEGMQNHNCQLQFSSAKPSHEDKWTCTLTSCKSPKDGGCSDKDASGISSEATFHVQVV